jgi:2,4-dienoyl-CoA reductase (NADPH2)
MAYPLLATPVAFGPMRLRNRVVCLPHGLNFAVPGTLRPTRRHAEYYAARARGGTGLVCVESTVSSWDGQAAAGLVISSDPACVDGYREVARGVHEAGARISGQITHFGLEACESLTLQPLVAPSTLPDPISGATGRPMDRDAMDRVTADFVASARTFVAAGFDAVELKLAHDGLLRQFMSPLTNDRDDEYGGSPENRMRFPLEIAAAVHDVLPASVAFGIRLVVDECLPGGYGLDDGIAYGRMLEGTGMVDYLSCDVGTSMSIAMVVPPMETEQGYAETAYARLSDACDVPVVAFGQIRTPDHAERILRDGHAAAVGMARQMLADPDWAAKALAGEPERIRPCTSCNQMCLGEALHARSIACTVNPWAGRGEHRPAPTVSAPRRVVVVGGGPAGMEAARVAAEDGHDVTLLEEREQLGGQLTVAARARGRARWQAYLDWLERELRHLGVGIEVGTCADAERVRALAPDHLVLATGSVATLPAHDPGTDVTGVESYLANGRADKRVVVAGFGAAGPALWTAAFESARRGAASVALVTALPSVAADLDVSTAQWLKQGYGALPITAWLEHDVAGMRDGVVTARSLIAGTEVEIEADVVVAVTRRRPAGGELVAGLDGAASLSVVGDALVPRDATAAIREGQRAGASVSG